MHQLKVREVMSRCASEERRGAVAASDHHLLLVTAKLHLKRHSATSSKTTRYDLGLLRNKEVEKRFQISLKNRYQKLQFEGVDGDGDVETQWHQSTVSEQ